MKTIQEVIANLKGGKSAYESMRICQSAKSTINKDELQKLQEMVEYYGGVNEELDQLNDNFVQTEDLDNVNEDIIE